MILVNMEAVDQNFIALGPLYKGVAMKHHVQKISFLVVQLIICAIFSLAAVHVMPEQPVNW